MESIPSLVSRWSEHITAATELSRRQRVLFAAVSETTPESIRESLLLARSIRAFGGTFAEAHIRMYFVERLPADVDAFAALGVELRVAPRFSTVCPHANKVAMFADADGYDYLVALDTDIVMVGDIVHHLVGDSIAVRLDSRDPLGTPVWRRLFEHFGLDVPAERYISVLTRTEMIAPYANGGVIIVPTHMLDELRASWSAWVHRLIEARPHFPEIALPANAYFTDQFAFTFALVETGLPRRILPLSMNYQSCFPVHDMYEPEGDTPLLLHYHHRLTDEGLTPAVYPLANEAIARVNRVLFGAQDAPVTSGRRRHPAGLRSIATARTKKQPHSAADSGHDSGSATAQPA